MSPSSPGSRISSTWSPASITESALGTKPVPSRSTEMISEPSGSTTSWTRWPAAGEPSPTSSSMISRCSSSSASSWTRPYSGTSCSIRRRIRSVADTAGWIPSSLKCWQVARVVDAGDDPLAAVLLLGHLADEDVVLVVAGDGDHQVGALDAGALEHPQLGRVAVLDGVLELLLDDPVSGGGRTRSASPRGPWRSARGRGSSPPSRPRR